MKKGDVIRQKCVNTAFYLTAILAHKVNNKAERVMYYDKNVSITRFSVLLYPIVCNPITRLI